MFVCLGFVDSDFGEKIDGRDILSILRRKFRDVRSSVSFQDACIFNLFDTTPAIDYNGVRNERVMRFYRFYCLVNVALTASRTFSGSSSS